MKISEKADQLLGISTDYEDNIVEIQKSPMIDSVFNDSKMGNCGPVFTPSRLELICHRKCGYTGLFDPISTIERVAHAFGKYCKT